MSARGFRVPSCRATLAACAAAWLVAAAAAAHAAGPGVRSTRGGGESQIDESAPDESGPAAPRAGDAAPLPGRLREFVEGSLARYDALKSEAVGFRRQGWFPSLFLRSPERDVTVERGPGGAAVVTVHLSYARRDLEQRIVIAPAGRFELPSADRRFFCELLGALASAAPEVSRARLLFWFGVLRADGQLTWESRGGIGLPAAAAKRYPAGSRTAEALWPLLDENTVPPSAWGSE